MLAKFTALGECRVIGTQNSIHVNILLSTEFTRALDFCPLVTMNMHRLSTEAHELWARDKLLNYAIMTISIICRLLLHKEKAPLHKFMSQTEINHWTQVFHKPISFVVVFVATAKMHFPTTVRGEKLKNHFRASECDLMPAFARITDKKGMNYESNKWVEKKLIRFLLNKASMLFVSQRPKKPGSSRCSMRQNSFTIKIF